MDGENQVNNATQELTESPVIAEKEVKVKGGPKKSLLKIVLPASIAGAAAIAAVTGVLVYRNTPAQRFLRQFNTGVKSLQEQDYETAKISFEKAIGIDEYDLEAYLGLLKAYSGLEDKEGLTDTYNSAYDVIEANYHFYTEEQQDLALGILKYVSEVYGDDKEKEIKSAELIHKMYPKDKDIIGLLTDDYFIVGKEKVAEGLYEEGIELLEKALELDPDNNAIRELRDRAVKDYICDLFYKGEFDRVMALVDQYKGVVDGIDEAFVKAEIEEIERIKAEDVKNQEYMKIVYDTMATEDYIAMLDMYNSEECQAFLQRMTRDVYYYFPEDDGSKSGMGAACYYDDNGYYFYYGNYVNGSREDYGTTFIGDGAQLYRYFQGTWSNDKPNGEGTEICRSTFSNTGEEYSSTTTGSLIGGKWNGHIDSKIYSGETFDVSFDAENGVPLNDRTAECSNTYNIRFPSTMYCYAFDGYFYGFGSYRVVYSYITFGNTRGTIGF